MTENTFNKSRCMIDCPRDCPKRRPACQDHCDRFKKSRAKFVERKAEYYGDPNVNQYMFARNEDHRDAAAKKRKSHGLQKTPSVDH